MKSGNLNDNFRAFDDGEVSRLFDDWPCFHVAEGDGLTADTVGRRTHGGVRVFETERRPEMVGSRGGRTR